MRTRHSTGLTWLFLCILGVIITGSCMVLVIPASAASATPIPSVVGTSQPECVLESLHPYPSFINQTWTITNPAAGATQVRLHFARLETESSYDVVILRDGLGQEVARYSGDFPSGFWSDVLAGDTVRVQMVTDGSRAGWGFCVDRVETVESSGAGVPVISTATSTPVPAPASNVHLRVEPAQSSVAQGMFFWVDVILATGAQPVDSVDMTLTFDPAILQVVDGLGKPAATVVSGTALPVPLTNRVDNEAGKIAFGAGRRLGDLPPSGELLIASIRFRALTQTLSLNGTPLSFWDTSQAYFEGQPILSATRNGAVIVQVPWFTGRVELEGRGSPPSRRWSSNAMTVTLSGEAGRAPQTYVTKTDENGYFVWLSPPSGTFNVRVKGAHTLSSMRERITLPAGDIIDFGRLREGDADGDDRITDADFALLAAAFGSRRDQPGWDQRADFNGDDRITAADFSLLSASYGLSGPITAEPKADPRVTPRPTMAGTMELWLEPARRLLDQDQMLDLLILLRADGKQVDAVDVHISFDSTILAVVDPQANLASQIMPGSALPTILLNEVDNGNGTITFGAGIALGDNPESGELHLATIRFKALRHTSNGLQGTVVEVDGGTEAYLAGVSQLTSHAGSAIVVSVGPEQAASSGTSN